MEKETLVLSTLINAPREIVWDVLLQDKTYRQWTEVFHPGSYAETDWQQGSKVLFKTPAGDGMVSKILVNKPNEVMSIEHLGILKDNKEYFDTEETKSWQGLKETYRLKTAGEQTELIIEQEITEKHAEWFRTTWEKALQKVKELAETSISLPVNTE
jgi:uncharacterized protein YndB with AHSA1/START domain